MRGKVQITILAQSWIKHSCATGLKINSAKTGILWREREHSGGFLSGERQTRDYQFERVDLCLVARLFREVLDAADVISADSLRFRLVAGIGRRSSEA